MMIRASDIASVVFLSC